MKHDNHFIFSCLTAVIMNISYYGKLVKHYLYKKKSHLRPFIDDQMSVKVKFLTI